MKRFLCWMLMVTALAACGGGGGGGGGGGTQPTITGFTPTSGQAGTTVTITGTNLTGAAVTFNGTAATVTGSSATQVTAVVPEGATTGTIRVTTGGGTATSSATFTVTFAGSAQITTPLQITTSSDAGKAVDATTTIALNLASSNLNLGNMVAKTTASGAAPHRVMDMVHRLTAQALDPIASGKRAGKSAGLVDSGTVACQDGGTYAYVTTYDPLNFTSVSSTYTYSNCRESGTITNGAISMVLNNYNTTGAPMSGTVTMGNSSAPYLTETYGSGYQVRFDRDESWMVMQIASFTSTETTDAGDITMTGYNEFTDYGVSPVATDWVGMNGFRFQYTSVYDTLGNISSESTSMNGAIMMSSYSGSVLVSAEDNTFQNFSLSATYGTNGTTMTLNGTFAFDVTPNDACIEGTFQVTTSSQAPLVYSPSGTILSGQMTVNGIPVTFSSGTATATINGQPYTLTNYADACTLSAAEFRF